MRFTVSIVVGGALAVAAVLLAAGPPAALASDAAAIEGSDSMAGPMEGSGAVAGPAEGSGPAAAPTEGSSAGAASAEGSGPWASTTAEGSGGATDGSGAGAEAPAPPAAFEGQIALARAALVGCPAADGSWDQAAWTWVLPHEEQALAAINLDGDETTFGLLADYEGTSIILRVRDATTEENLAVVKTTSSNTRVDAEIYAWRLANLLGFGSLVAPTSPVLLDGDALQKMRDLLAATRYDDEYKESNRQRVVRDLDAALRDGSGYNGAIKPWIPAFSYVGALGERERLAEHTVMDFLVRSGPQPDDRAVELEQFTRLYSPRGTQRGVLALWELAEDVSNLLLMDALMGQNDRFAGANVHFRSLAGARAEIGERRGLPIWDLGAVRLLALDNGAALRGQNGSGFSDIQGRVVRGTRVERFEGESVELVRGLARHVLGHGCPSAPTSAESDAILAFLGLQPGGDEAARAVGYLENVVGYLDELGVGDDEDTLLAPPPPAPPAPAAPAAQPAPDAGDAPVTEAGQL